MKKASAPQKKATSAPPPPPRKAAAPPAKKATPRRRAPVLPLSASIVLLALALLALFVAPAAMQQPVGPTATPAPVAGVGASSVRYDPQPPADGYPVAAPLRIIAQVPTIDAGGDPSQVNDVTVQLLDLDGQPAEFGGQPAPPQSMTPQMLSTSQQVSWVADLSTPTLPGIYRARLVATAPGADPQYFEPQSQITVVSPSSVVTSGFVYPRDGNLWLTSSDGARTRKLTFYGGDYPAGQPSWSPDGTMIAFGSGVPSGAGGLPTSDIHVLDLRTGADRLVAQHRPFEGLSYPAWAGTDALLFTADYLIDPATGVAPDRSSIDLALEYWSIDRIGLDGVTRSFVVHDAVTPDVSRNGQVLTYVARGGDLTSGEGTVQTSIVVANVDGTQARTLVPPGQFPAVYRPRVSPDGALVAFAAMDPDQPTPAEGEDIDVAWDIYVIPTAGGAAKRVSDFGANQAAASWGADDNSLAVLAGLDLYVVHLDGSAPTPIAAVEADGDVSWGGK